jgi:hypothetical protein
MDEGDGEWGDGEWGDGADETIARDGFFYSLIPQILDRDGAEPGQFRHFIDLREETDDFLGFLHGKKEPDGSIGIISLLFSRFFALIA